MSLPLFSKSFSFTFATQASSFIQISAGFSGGSVSGGIQAAPGWRWCGTLPGWRHELHITCAGSCSRQERVGRPLTSGLTNLLKDFFKYANTGALSVWRSAQKSKWRLFRLLQSKIFGGERTCFSEDRDSGLCYTSTRHLIVRVSHSIQRYDWNKDPPDVCVKGHRAYCQASPSSPCLLQTTTDFDARGSASPGCCWWCRQDARTHETSGTGGRGTPSRRCSSEPDRGADKRASRRE